MCDIPGLLQSLRPEELAQLKQRGGDGVLEAPLVDAIDRAAGGPGEGRGYYVVRGQLYPAETRSYYLRSDVAAAVVEA
ncbi:hypothetical protein [Arthrobacter sp. M4]|uniref:hypothetical protein n=1 Tax=Arthrobacter sp. M4 TaxID=218160 RepID=UPI001CDD48BA|nr:hypothetical protein [Arthrobacter sp. M4]MCA4134779.1 hypothetical protein [Arthrobacter sp. M4]